MMPYLSNRHCEKCGKETIHGWFPPDIDDMIPGRGEWKCMACYQNSPNDQFSDLAKAISRLQK